MVQPALPMSEHAISKEQRTWQGMAVSNAGSDAELHPHFWTAEAHGGAQDALPLDISGLLLDSPSMKRRPARPRGISRQSTSSFKPSSSAMGVSHACRDYQAKSYWTDSQKTMGDQSSTPSVKPG